MNEPALPDNITWSPGQIWFTEDALRKERVIWSAGFLDGEGSIGIAKLRRKEPGKAPSFVLTVRATNTARDPLAVLQLLWGGTLKRSEHKRRDKPLWRPFFNWALHSQKAAIALEEMLPYLIGKRLEAELALEFAARRQGKGVWRTADQIAWDFQAYRQMRDLKRVHR